MKALALVLALLAAGKIGTVEYLRHAAAQDAVIAAYGASAIAACERTKAIVALEASATNWSRPQSMRFVVGDASHTVRLWQVDSADWAARFRKSYLVLRAGPVSQMHECTFDTATGLATVQSSKI